MTSLETSDYKVFLIKDAHNMTISAANSLLKFLEEPSSSVLGILISDEIESLLPTIVSRCTTLNFKRLSYVDNYEIAKSMNIDNLDAYYFARVISTYLSIDTFIEHNAYIIFKEAFKRFVDVFYKSADQALYVIHSVLLAESDKGDRALAVKFFIDMLLVFFKDINSMLEVDDWYNTNLKIYKDKTKYLSLLEVVLQSKNQFNNNINVALLMDQMLYKFKEVNV